ncbi:MAG: TetR/AcrR family transcriptional regulator [Clostridia bacterium]|nr:TetR/AcrR family transcriptional regulator [Clostridia bacterium]MCI2013645.1 TetR/AcrR family transcriptional regulator [Clostridia bacterium]
MKKAISKEQIIDTALKLLSDKQDFKSINIREIARTIGCAHTNIYNYFSSSADLLWELHSALLGIFITMLRKNVSAEKSPKIRLRKFWETFLQFYLDNIGWFRLVWMIYIGDKRPESNIIATKMTKDELDKYMIDIWEELSGYKSNNKKVSETVHNVHCYIIGEVSNYISGRGLIKNTAEFKNYVVDNAIRLLTLSLQEE